MRLRIQTRNVLHTLTLARVERFHDSEWGYCEDDEGDVGFEFRWHRDEKDWFPDVGRAINAAMWDQQRADERRLFPGEYWFLGRWADRQMRAVHHRRMKEMAGNMTMNVPRGGITFLTLPPVDPAHGSDENRLD